MKKGYREDSGLKNASVNEAELKLGVKYINKQGKEGFIQTGGSKNSQDWLWFDGKVKHPYNKVKMNGASAMSIPDATMEYLTRIEAFAKKHDVLVIVVAHPTKMYKKDDGTMDEPTMYSIKGGGEWYDASYHGLLVHRNYTNKTVKVKVLKVKFQNLGENQAEAHFKWNKDSGDYIPHEQELDSMPWEG